ncbi:hypothetical protein ABFS83_13G119600 [Erythranthe nasuta]
MVCRKIDKNQLDFFCWFFCVVTILSLAGFVAWLSLIPRSPIFKISDAHFPSPDSQNHSTRSNISVPNRPLIFNLEIFNPNKRMGIYYSGINMELYSGGDGGGVVGRNSTPGFYQGHKNTTLLQIVIQANQEIWPRGSGGNLDFVRFKTGVVFRIIKWKTKLRQIACDEQFSIEKVNNNGTVLGGNYAEQQNASRVKIRN